MKISVITATFNAERHLSALIKSLQAQTNKEFEWVIADGGSTDQTLYMLNNAEGLNISLTSQPDFGIYDALNRAIKASRSEYYVVIGADDIFSPTAVERFIKEIDDECAAVTSPILINNKVYNLSSLPTFLSGFRSKICGHSIATLFKKSLHEKYGYYSQKYPIAADYDFMMKLVLNNEKVKLCSFISGTFGLDGVSSVDRIGSASEVMRIMVSNGFSTPIQVLIFILRLIYSSLPFRR